MAIPAAAIPVAMKALGGKAAMKALGGKAVKTGLSSKALSKVVQTALRNTSDMSRFATQAAVDAAKKAGTIKGGIQGGAIGTLAGVVGGDKIKEGAKKVGGAINKAAKAVKARMSKMK